MYVARRLIGALVAVRAVIGILSARPPIERDTVVEDVCSIRAEGAVAVVVHVLGRKWGGGRAEIGGKSGRMVCRDGVQMWRRRGHAAFR